MKVEKNTYYERKRFMKKTKMLAIFLILVMVMSFAAGCSNNDANTPTDGPIVIKIGHTDSSQRSTHIYSEA